MIGWFDSFMQPVVPSILFFVYILSYISGINPVLGKSNLKRWALFIDSIILHNHLF